MTCVGMFTKGMNSVLRCWRAWGHPCLLSYMPGIASAHVKWLRKLPLKVEWEFQKRREGTFPLKSASGRLLGGGDFWRMSRIQTCSHGQILFFFFSTFLFFLKKRKFFPFLEDQLKDCFLLTRSCWLELFMFSQHPHWQRVINSANVFLSSWEGWAAWGQGWHLQGSYPSAGQLVPPLRTQKAMCWMKGSVTKV